MIRNFQFVLMNEASPEGGEGASAPSQQSPNEGWQNNPNLDENGNPVGEQQPNKTNESADNESVDKNNEQSQETNQQGTSEETTQREYDLDSPVVKQVENLLKEAGLDVLKVAEDVNNNDGKPSPELVKALADKHGDAVASIIAEQLQGFHASRKAQDAKRNQAVFDQVQDAFKDVTNQTGKETWNELSGWAKDNIADSERREINKLLSQGGLAAKYAVDDLVSRFKSSDSFVQQADLLTGDNTANDFGVKPLSKAEYTAALRELEAKGHVYGQSQAMMALDKRRMAGMQRGI